MANDDPNPTCRKLYLQSLHWIPYSFFPSVFIFTSGSAIPPNFVTFVPFLRVVII